MEEKKNLEIEKKKLTNALEDSKLKCDAIEKQYWAFRQEQDESPMAVLRA